MNNNKVSDKYLTRVAYSYGLIVALVNYLGFVLAVSGGMPVVETADYNVWLDFIIPFRVCLLDIRQV